MNSSPLPLFAATGVELEYMMVDAATLDVRPLSDALIQAVTGACQSDVERGPFCWCNELVLHVIELKTSQPAPALRGLADGFQAEVREVNRFLDPLGARLMPSAMHPWMDPLRETRLWPHEYSPVYQAYDRIFGCQGHGWSNLQSVHLNLPFADDAEFGRLHAAIRAALPLLPALAASSPILDGRGTGWLDNRLAVYRTNSARIPSITGRVIPEPVYTRAEYEREILQRLYRDIAPFDPEGVLQDEFLNARGAIARFGRGSIEIRVLDVQECPRADLALTQLIVAVIRALAEERWMGMQELQALDTASLESVLLATMRDAEQAVVSDRELLSALGWQARKCTAGELWRNLERELAVADSLDPGDGLALRHLLEHGSLARRILKELAGDFSRPHLHAVFSRLCDCLNEGSLFAAGPSHR